MNSVIEVLGVNDQPLAIEVNIGMRTARDLRSLLLEAAYALKDNADTFLALLFKSGFTPERLTNELDGFKAVVRSEIADRVNVRAIDSPQEIDGVLRAHVGAGHMPGLSDRIIAASTGLPTSSSREAVQFLLLWRWLHGFPPIKTAALAEQSGASPPTVSAAIKALPERDVLRTRDRQVALKSFSPEAWQKWLTKSADAPSVSFADRSGASRVPEQLARTLSEMALKDVAIGGVLGAMHHSPALGITRVPQLDILIHGTQHADLSFIERLEPALVREDVAPGYGLAQTQVVVHFTNRLESHFDVQNGYVWADGLDCLVQMWQAGLTQQVEGFISYLNRQAKQSHERKHG